MYDVDKLNLMFKCLGCRRRWNPSKKGFKQEESTFYVSCCTTDCSPCIRSNCIFTGAKKQWFVLILFSISNNKLIILSYD